MKTRLFLLLFAIALVGVALGWWLTLIVDTFGIYGPPVFRGREITAAEVLVSDAFSTGTGPGVIGLFLVPNILLWAILCGRKGEVVSLYSTVMFAAAWILLGYICVSVGVVSVFWDQLRPLLYLLANGRGTVLGRIILICLSGGIVFFALRFVAMIKKK